MESALNSIDNRIMIDVLTDKKLLKQAIETGKIAIGQVVDDSVNASPDSRLINSN